MCSWWSRTNSPTVALINFRQKKLCQFLLIAMLYFHWKCCNGPTNQPNSQHTYTHMLHCQNTKKLRRAEGYLTSFVNLMLFTTFTWNKFLLICIIKNNSHSPKNGIVRYFMLPIFMESQKCQNFTERELSKMQHVSPTGHQERLDTTILILRDPRAQSVKLWEL